MTEDLWLMSEIMGHRRKRRQKKPQQSKQKQYQSYRIDPPAQSGGKSKRRKQKHRHASAVEISGVALEIVGSRYWCAADH